MNGRKNLKRDMKQFTKQAPISKMQNNSSILDNEMGNQVHPNPEISILTNQR